MINKNIILMWINENDNKRDNNVFHEYNFAFLYNFTSFFHIVCHFLEFL